MDVDRPARVAIADDERMFRTSLRHLLTVSPPVVREMFAVDVGRGFTVVGEAGSGQETVEIVQSVRPDLLLLDLSMPRRSGLDALRDLRDCNRLPPTIVLSGTLDKSQLAVAIQLGARGVVRKDAATELLFEAMTRVVGGASWVDRPLMSDLFDIVRAFSPPIGAAAKRPWGLTRREREVMSLVGEGCNNREIARRFAVSEQTIKHHLTRIFDKVGAANRAELAFKAARYGLLA